MAATSNALDHPLYPLQEVIGVSCGSVAPVARLFSSGILLGQRNVDSAKLGAYDWRGRVMSSAFVHVCDVTHKHVSPGFWTENGVQACTRLL